MKVSQTELCNIFDIDPKTIRIYTRQGMPIDQKGRKGIACVYDTCDVRVWLENRAVEQAVGDSEGKSREYWETLISEEKAKQEIIKTAQLKKSVVLVEDMERVVSSLIVKFGARLDSLISTLPPLFENKNRQDIKAILTKEIRAIRQMLSIEDLRDEQGSENTENQ